MKKEEIITVRATAENMLTVYSSIFVWQPFSCQSNFRLLIPFSEYKQFILQAEKENLIHRLFSASEAVRYSNLIATCSKASSADAADDFLRFYYLNDLLRLGTSEIRRAYERQSSPTWIVGDFGSEEELDYNDLQEYVLTELHKLRNHPGCNAKMNEIKDIAYLCNCKSESYRTYILLVLVALWNKNVPKLILTLGGSHNGRSKEA